MKGRYMGMQPPPHLMLNNRWFLFEDTKNSMPPAFQPQKKKTKHFLGFVYIDHDAGISVHVEAFCKMGFMKKIKPIYSFTENGIRTVLRFERLRMLSLRPLKDKEIDYLKLDRDPDWLQHYRNPVMEQLRTIPLLHPLRAEGYPDDIKFVIGPKEEGQQPEEVWGRLVRQVKNEHFECRLLNQPHQDLGYKVGDHVIVLVAFHPQGLQVICLGHADDLNESLD